MALMVGGSAREGLVRSCDGADWVTTSRPGEGVELLRAWFGGRAFARHRHDTYAIGVTEAGVQTFDYRGRVERSTPRPGRRAPPRRDARRPRRNRIRVRLSDRLRRAGAHRRRRSLDHGTPGAPPVRARARLRQPDAGTGGHGGVSLLPPSPWRSTRWCSAWPRGSSTGTLATRRSERLPASTAPRSSGPAHSWTIGAPSSGRPSSRRSRGSTATSSPASSGPRMARARTATR